MSEESKNITEISNLTKKIGNNESIANEYKNKNDIGLQQAIQKPCGCGKMEGENSNEANPSYIYAVGKIEMYIPSPHVEMEYRRIIAATETKGQTDYEAMRSVLSSRSNRYLVREMCWVLTIEGVTTYILKPQDPGDFELLANSLRNVPDRNDMDLVIGIKGPIAPPDMCNGLTLPIVIFDQIYTFNREEMLKRIQEKRPENISAKKFGDAAVELFERIMQMADNAGATDEHRVLNYLAVTNPLIYTKTTEMFGRDFSLTSIEVRPSRLRGMYERILDVIFSYTNRNTAVEEKYFVRVSVDKYPFVITQLSPYYDRM